MLTLKYGISPDYVLDKMQWYEIKGLMRYEYFKKKDDWEQARLIAFVIAQVNSKKKLKMDEIVPFYWESENEKSSTSKEEFERLKIKAQEYIKKCKNTITK